jgi:rfaE bifunctional protein nucleotidyltransferase chain/domain
MLTVAEAAAFVETRRRRGQRIVFTNGVFDLLHPGHVRYLQAARALGDVLVVALHSDRLVRANHGPSRPIVPEHERAEVLDALSAVDAVMVLDDETPQAIIERLRPDVLVTGTEWAADASAGRTVEAGGGRVVRLAAHAEWSTSAIILKAKATPNR